MPLPVENVIAAFPPTFRAGNVTLRPLSIGGAIRLAQVGVDVRQTPVPKDKLFAAAWILSVPSAPSPTGADKEFRRFLRRAKCGLKELAGALEEALNAAFATLIPPMQERDAPAQLTPSGLGWPLVLAEWLCAEYGWSWAAALETPAATAFALQAAARIRHGEKHGGPDYVERTLDIVKGSGN